jgi:hypothetical protein
MLAKRCAAGCQAEDRALGCLTNAYLECTRGRPHSTRSHARGGRQSGLRTHHTTLFMSSNASWLAARTLCRSVALAGCMQQASCR